MANVMDSTGTKYRVFSRAARNWEEFALAHKRTVKRGLAYSEAQRMCYERNTNRTPAEQRRGFKFEFEAE